MKIYELSKIPGIGNEPPKEPDYEAIFQSGYTAGYDDGYASKACYENKYLTIKALEDGSFSLLNLATFYGGWDGYTRLNGGEWEIIPSGTTNYNLTEGDVMEMKGVYTGRIFMVFVTLTLKSKVYGNILSLRDGDDFSAESEQAIVLNSGLFSNSTGLVDASNLILPGETPRYAGMFFDCTNLTGVPELPATQLREDSYLEMFRGCTSLTEAPELPATTLTDYCYSRMFSGCSSLSQITCLATDISALNCLTKWLDGVSPTGTFVKAPGMNDWPRDENGIPTGWTVIDAE